ncbi:hypothetical protein ALC62_01286 [Cyphomyrmex costatus]|uniref:Pupal cuticle protein n=1 Tax=Cyphomyrmex costatus TaxID=456900 RepID=A0A195D4E8_9HYME|nr:hypothetical protein ALC62_01286 [Cyphomyrmex costatus]
MYLKNTLHNTNFFQTVLSTILACAFASSPLILTKLVPGAPIGLDGRVIDTAEVSLAKAEHAAAHINEKINLAAEAVKSADVLTYVAPSNVALVENSAHLVQPVAVAAKLTPGAPIGLDGRVVDTPEVTLAKAEHAAAHINHFNEKLTKSIYEQPAVILDRLIFLLATAMTCRAAYVGSSPYGNPLVHQQVAPNFAPSAPVGEDGNVIDTPEVAQAKAVHFAEFARAAARAAQDENQQSLSGYQPQISSPAYSYSAAQPTAVPYLKQASYQQPTPIYQTANHVPSPIYVNYQQPQQYDARANFVGQKSYTLPGKPGTFVPAPLAEDGTVLDTPEVAALKATRLAELADAEARAYKHASENPSEHQGQAYGFPSGPAPANYNSNLGHYGASRAFPGSSYPGTQPYATQQVYNPSGFQPHHYQPQHQG